MFELVAQNDIRFERITVDDGLSQSSITCMVQDKFGYLWIGTLDGLNKYDGNSFKIYRNDNLPNSFGSRNVFGLFLDGHERLWIAYRNGISLYNPELDNFRNYSFEVLPGKNIIIRDLTTVSDTLLTVSTNFGVYHFNVFNGEITPAQEYSDFSGKNVWSLIFTNGRYNWLATDSALWRQVPGSSKWEFFFNPNSRLYAFYVDHEKELYIRSEEKLWKYDSILDKLDVIGEVSADQWPGSHAILKTKDDKLWVAHGGISIYDEHNKFQQQLRHVSQDPNSLSGTFVSEIYETRDGVIWVGTNGLGLNKYDPYRSVFNYIGYFPGAEVTLSDSYITSIYTEDDQNLLVSTLDGLTCINLPGKKSRHIPIIGKDGVPGRIHKIVKGAEGKFLLATTKGLYFYEKDAIRYSGVNLPGSPGPVIYDIVNAGSSAYLLATNQVVFLLDQSHNTVEAVYGFGSPLIQKVNDYYWLESNDRIQIADLTNRKIIKVFPQNGSDSLHAPLAPLKCIYQAKNKNIWIGTDGGGFSLYDTLTDTFKHFTTQNGLANNVVYGILEDKSGNLWLSTNRGISVFDPGRSSFIRHFSRSDGLQSDEFNTRAYFRSPDSKLYFGGVNGLSFFYPELALGIPSFTPKTILTGFYINNIRQEPGKSTGATRLFSKQAITLRWNERNFSFEIAGLGFTFPSGIQYQYILEGFDKNWNHLGNQNRISFTNMAAGDYTLRVRSGSVAGSWEPEPLAISIRVVAPLWRNMWFVSGVVTVLTLLIAFSYFQRVSFLKKRAALLQAMVAERTKEIQRQGEEIAAQNEELSAQAEALENANLELEKRVERRTRRLKQLSEELIDQNTQLQQFAYVTAHNIRGPVARIQGLISLIQPGNLSEMVKHLELSAKNLDDVITDLNTVLSITNAVNKKFEIVPVKEQLEVALNQLQCEIEEIKAFVDISGFGDLKILGFKPYFQSIFYQLIHNALKYSDPVKPCVVRCYTIETTDRINIVMEDNGIGIDMRYAKDKIFKLHQRFHSNSVGKGIGLYLVKTQVRAMGGKIDIESEVNAGARFMLDFPRYNK